MDKLTAQFCNTCQQGATFYCNGCSNTFCQNHANEHRLTLYEQLDWLTVEHDDLINTLDNNVAIKQISQSSSVVIDKWEEESIKHIQKTADEARRSLLDALKSHINDVKLKLRALTDKLSEVCQNSNSNFDERNIKRWAAELHNLKYEYLTTPAFTVRIHGNKPVVMPIIKIQPDSSQDKLTNKKEVNSFGLVPIKSSPSSIELKSNSMKENNTSHRPSLDQTTNYLSNNDDRFYLSSNYFKIIDYNQIVTHDSTNNHASARGSHQYHQGEHKLYFRIEHIASNEWIFFGIVSKSVTLDSQSHTDSSAYGWTGYDHVYINGKAMSTINGCVNNMKRHDFVELTIDCDNKTLYLWHSRQTYKNKLVVDTQLCPFPWQFLISSPYPNSSVRILPSSFDTIIKKEQAKLNKCAKLKDENKSNLF